MPLKVWGATTYVAAVAVAVSVAAAVAVAVAVAVAAAVAAASVVSVSDLCDQVDQIVPANQVDDEDEVHHS